MTTPLRSSMLRTLDGTEQPAVRDGQMSPATQAHIARIAQSPIITHPARTIARGILLTMLALAGVVLLFGVIWLIGSYLLSRVH